MSRLVPLSGQKFLLNSTEEPFRDLIQVNLLRNGNIYIKKRIVWERSITKTKLSWQGKTHTHTHTLSLRRYLTLKIKKKGRLSFIKNGGRGGLRGTEKSSFPGISFTTSFYILLSRVLMYKTLFWVPEVV